MLITCPKCRATNDVEGQESCICCGETINVDKLYIATFFKEENTVVTRCRGMHSLEVKAIVDYAKSFMDDSDMVQIVIKPIETINNRGGVDKEIIMITITDFGLFTFEFKINELVISAKDIKEANQEAKNQAKARAMAKRHSIPQMLAHVLETITRPDEEGVAGSSEEAVKDEYPNTNKPN